MSELKLRPQKGEKQVPRPPKCEGLGMTMRGTVNVKGFLQRPACGRQAEADWLARVMRGPFEAQDKLEAPASQR